MKKGDIVIVELSATFGHEQSGRRPVVLLSEPQSNIVVVVPITSNVQALRFPYTLEIKPSNRNGLDTTSIALIFQLRAIDKGRIINKIGNIEESKREQIDMLIKKLLSF